MRLHPVSHGALMVLEPLCDRERLWVEDHGGEAIITEHPTTLADLEKTALLELTHPHRDGSAALVDAALQAYAQVRLEAASRFLLSLGEVKPGRLVATAAALRGFAAPAGTH